jgi:HK97 family phage major capsid protein
MCSTPPQCGQRTASKASRAASSSLKIGFCKSADRTGMRVLRDPYSAKPYVLFYTTKRVGGGVQDFDAIKLLKFA